MLAALQYFVGLYEGWIAKRFSHIKCSLSSGWIGVAVHLTFARVERKWWICSNAIKLCKQNRNLKYINSSYLRAQISRKKTFAIQMWMSRTHTHSLCQNPRKPIIKHTHVSVDWRQATHSMHAYQTENFFFSLSALSLGTFLPFVVTVCAVAVAVAVHYISFSFAFHCSQSIMWMCTQCVCVRLWVWVFVKIEPHVIIFSDVKLPAGDVSLIKMTCKEPISARVAA